MPAMEPSSDSLQHVAGLASLSVMTEHAPDFAAAIEPFHTSDDGVADEDFPPRVCFLPLGYTASATLTAEVAGRGALLGVHVPLFCSGPQWEITDKFQRQWDDAVQAAHAAKEAGQKVKVILHDALAADTYDLALIAANLCDAGADILTLEALGDDVDTDELRAKVEAMCENDVLGVPMSMRIGACLHSNHHCASRLLP